MTSATTAKRITGWIGTIACGAALLGAQAAADATYWRKPATVPGFNRYRPELQRLVDEYGKPGPHRFCVVVRDPQDRRNGVKDVSNRQLIVYWPQQSAIYFYGLGINGRPDAQSQDFGATIDLKEDVVPTEEDIAGSTSRRTLASVNALIRHCNASGTKVMLLRRSGHR